MNTSPTPLPKMSRSSANLNPLSNIKTLASPDTFSKSVSIEKPISKDAQKVGEPNEKAADKSKEKFHPKGNILHVSNICPKMTYEQIKKGLYDLFSIHGPIYEIIIKTKQTGQHFAFVDFPDINHAESAWNASRTVGKRLENKLLMVNYCQDPKKNMDRKDQKCFLCHGTGHKAIKCPVKPEMIKRKQKKIDEGWSQEDQTNYVQKPTNKKVFKQIQPVPQLDDKSQSQHRRRIEDSSSQQIERDKDYLRFLKLKKRLLEKSLKKKLKKSKKKKN